MVGRHPQTMIRICAQLAAASVRRLALTTTSSAHDSTRDVDFQPKCWDRSRSSLNF